MPSNEREGLESVALPLARHLDRQFEYSSVLQKEQRLSFATLAMFLGQNCIFDSTLVETWLSLRKDRGRRIELF
jgi:hypothetical protein